MIKKYSLALALYGIALQPTTIYAQTAYQYVIHSHNITSISPTITDVECVKLFSESEFYNIVDDIPQYADTAHQKNKNYQRRSTTFVSNSQQLFLGKSEFDTTINNRSVHLTQDIYFQLDLDKRMIRGGWIIPGYCKGNFIGTDQHVQKWPRT